MDENPDVTMRLFVALLFPETVQAHFREVLCSWREEEVFQGARWAHDFHVTLKFFGEVPPKRVEPLSTALEGAFAGSETFSVTGGELGTFPEASRASVLWQGIEEGAEALRNAARRAEEITTTLGFERERRPFVSHVTLARFRQPTNLTQWLTKIAVTPFPPFTATEYALLESELRPSGAVYTVLRVYPLKGAPTGNGA